MKIKFKQAASAEEINCEIFIYDEIARSLADQFLPPHGSVVTQEELDDACQRLTDATIATQLFNKQGAMH